MTTRLQVRRDSAANWTSNNPVLFAGEFGYETDIGGLKVGDGATAWTSLGYLVDDFHYQYTSAGSALGPTIADYFPSPSSPNLRANSTYEITAKLYFLKTTAGTVTWTWVASSSLAAIFAEYIGTVATGFTATVGNGAPITGQAAIQTNTTLAHAATASLTGAPTAHVHTFRTLVRTSSACNLRLRITQSAGTATPQAGSYLTAKLIYNHGSTAA